MGETPGDSVVEPPAKDGSSEPLIKPAVEDALGNDVKHIEEDTSEVVELERLKQSLKPPTQNTIKTEALRRKRALETGVPEADFIRNKRKEKKLKRQEKRRKEYLERIKGMTEEELIKQSQERKLLKQTQIRRMQSALLTGQRVAVDLGYVQHSTERDVKSVIKQFAYMQKPNREHAKPFSIHLTSCNVLWREALKKTGGLNWKMHFNEKSVFEVFTREEIVYLSPDAENELTELREDKVYIIGGIVDRTVKKGLSLQRARDHQVEVRKLPMSRIKFLGKYVLNIDTMIEVLLNFQINNDWDQVLRDYLPPRYLHPDELALRKRPYAKTTKVRTKRRKNKKNKGSSQTSEIAGCKFENTVTQISAIGETPRSIASEAAKGSLASDTQAPLPSGEAETTTPLTSNSSKSNSDFRKLLGL